MGLLLGFISRLVVAVVVVAVLVAGGVGLRYVLWSPLSLGSFYIGRDVVNLGHRGAPEHAPENTIPAFLAALNMGAHGVELDVLKSRDGAIIVIHDDDLDRTTDGQGMVNHADLSYIKSLDAGAWFGAGFARTQVPTLEEVFAALPPGTLVNVEIKSETPSTDGLESAVAAFISDRGLYDSVIVSSFNPISLWRIKRADRNIPTALLYMPDLPVYLSNGWFVPIVLPDALHPHYSMVDEEYMARARRKGFRVNVWTVNDEDEMRRLIDLGVDGIITDRPHILHGVLEGR